jgi:alpha,alpha-trehalase
LERVGEIVQEAGERPMAFFLDYDGTLTPIVPRPEDAVLSSEMREAVRELASHCAVAVVSGRGLWDIKKRVGIDGISYVGNHGFELQGPDGRYVEREDAAEILPLLDRAEQALFRGLADVGGVRLERKKFSVAVHYRGVPEDEVEAVKRAFEEVAAGYPGLRGSYGKKVLELQPDMRWNKGEAVLWLMEQWAYQRKSYYPIYLGDDVTDEDAFKVILGKGKGIIVHNGSPKSTYARYIILDPAEVKDFLEEISRTIMRAGS